MKTTLLCKAGLAAIAVLTVFSCASPNTSNVGERIAALDDSSWSSSEWISAADAEVVTVKVPDDRWHAASGASWFVSSVKNEGKVVSAKWMTSGLGVYDIYVNGCLVGNEFLKPGFTHYEKTKYSFTYDITEAFNTGSGAENVLAAQVTPGWWADKIITPGGKIGMNGKKCAFRGVLELVYNDGTRKYYGTDLDNWKAGILLSSMENIMMHVSSQDMQMQTSLADLRSILNSKESSVLLTAPRSTSAMT